VKNAR